MASLPLGGFLPLAWRRLRRYPLSTIAGLLRLDGYASVSMPECSHELFFGASADIDPRDWQRRLVRESFTVASELAWPRVYARPDLLRIPVLVVAGGRDAVFPVGAEYRLARACGAS